MDQYNERAAEAPGDIAVTGDFEVNESVSRLVAYSSPYIFWVTVVALSAGILMLQ